MRCDVIRLHGLVACAVAGHQPDHQAGFIQQQRGAVRADLIGPRPVFAVHADNLLGRLRRCRHELLRTRLRESVRIDKRILIVHLCPVASSVIRI